MSGLTEGQECFGFIEKTEPPVESYIRKAYRLEIKRIRENDFPYLAKETMSSPATVAKFASSLQESDVEKMLVLFLDAANHLICIQISAGTIDRHVIYSREIVKHALLSNAKSLILVHNHPSGTLETSQEDRGMTKTISEACNLFDIKLLDHIIIGEEGKFLSFTEAHLMPFFMPS